MEFFYFSVRVPAVKGVSRTAWREYIQDAVKSWGGQFEPAAGGYPDSPPGDGNPLGPPCDWNKHVQVMLRVKP